jgi:hypothetical protein
LQLTGYLALLIQKSQEERPHNPYKASPCQEINLPLNEKSVFIFALPYNCLSDWGVRDIHRE